MVKKTVKLVPQERFDLIDARALQQGTLEYIGNALGNLMGYSNGLLSELTTRVDSVNKTITFTEQFAFFVTKAASSVGFNADGTGYSGEVVIFDPTDTIQQSAAISVDYTSAKNAKDTYFSDNSVDAQGNNADASSRLLTVGAHAPFLWSRPIRVEGQLDARRKWSIAQQTEVPVTMNTRTITAVEFALSASMPEVGDGSNWAPIAKVVQWTGDSPLLLPISAFDQRQWSDRANIDSLGDIDRSTLGTQADWFSNESPNLSTWNIFEKFSAANSPALSLVYDMLLNETGWTNVAAPGANKTIISRLAQLDDYVEGGGTLGSANIGIKRNGQAAAWNKFTNEASNGLVDQLAAIRTVIQNAVGSGILDHGSENLASYPLLKPYESGSSSNLRNVFSALSNAFESHWSARPLRSVNSLALENLCLSSEVAKHDTEISTLKTQVSSLINRVTTLESYTDPFTSVPITDAQPLVPAFSMVFHPSYSGSASGVREPFTVRSGPADSGATFEFFILANMYSQITYARGGLRLNLPRSLVVSMGSDLSKCVIQATPVHNVNSSPWLHPNSPYSVGRTEQSYPHAVSGNNFDSQAESLRKLGGKQVLNAFANFYQCTLNVVIGAVKDDLSVDIEIHPVNTVPDFVENGHDLRGYPAYGKWSREVVGNDPSNTETNDAHEGTFRDAGIQVRGVSGQYEAAVGNDGYTGTRGGTAYGYLHGDTTNPDIYRKDINSAAFAKTNIFGATDDLRGFCQTVTFLRPDRYSYAATGGNEFNNASPVLTSAHSLDPSTAGTASNAPIGAIGNGVGNANAIPDHGDSHFGSAAISTNGRFMPGFSLVIYKDTFTRLGATEAESKTVLSPDNAGTWSVNYNDASVPDTNGVVQTSGDTSTRGGS